MTASTSPCSSAPSELALLEDALDDVAEGRAAVVSIEGAAGIGKTTLSGALGHCRPSPDRESPLRVAVDSASCSCPTFLM